MDKTSITDSEYLFAIYITDGVIEEMDEQQKSSVILVIKEMLQKSDNTQNETK